MASDDSDDDYPWKQLGQAAEEAPPRVFADDEPDWDGMAQRHAAVPDWGMVQGHAAVPDWDGMAQRHAAVPDWGMVQGHAAVPDWDGMAAVTDWDGMAQRHAALPDWDGMAHAAWGEPPFGRAIGPPFGRAVPRDWNNPFRSRFTRHYAPDVCHKVSTKFKKSEFDYALVIISHGGTVDDGTQGIVRRPMFRTGQNVIFPVRFGSSILVGNSAESMMDFASKIPMPREGDIRLTGEKLEHALTQSSFTKCIRQYDVGETVPNLEVFTPGMHIGDDAIFLYKPDEYTFMSLNPHMKHVVRKAHKKLVKTETPTQKFNMRPVFKLKVSHKRERKLPDDTPLTLADLCDEEYGLFKPLFAKLKRDGYMKQDVEVSNVPVLVLACRAGPEFSDRSTHPTNSPVSSDYDTNGGRNATKKRRNRRNATKKRRK